MVGCRMDSWAATAWMKQPIYSSATASSGPCKARQAYKMRKPGGSDCIQPVGLDGWHKALAVLASATGGLCPVPHGGNRLPPVVVGAASSTPSDDGDWLLPTGMSNLSDESSLGPSLPNGKRILHSIANASHGRGMRVADCRLGICRHAKTMHDDSE
jgi:hypothetical protein